MAIVFPKDPYIGIKFSSGDNTWTWDGVAWNILKPESTSLNILTLVPGAEPTSTTEGMLAIADGSEWDPSGNGDVQLMIYLDDEWQEVTVGESYTLPVATTDILGGVKVDGTTVIINNGVISAIEGGSITLTNSFETIAVPGQQSVVATTASDTLNLIPGSGISISTEPGSDSITISNSQDLSQIFSFSVAGDDSTQRLISNNELIKFIGGTGISTTTDDEGNVTISATGAAGTSNFNDLTEVSAANLTIDKIYLPAITMLVVTNSGASAYRFDQYGTDNNPTIYAISGTTIAFNLQASGHPFLIQSGAGVNFDTGLVHVSTSGVVSLGAAAQGKDSGTLYWKVPGSISGGYRYQCSAHVAMVGSLTVKAFSII